MVNGVGMDTEEEGRRAGSRCGVIVRVTGRVITLESGAEADVDVVGIRMEAMVRF
jgi:hypothetical protein